MKVWSTPLSTHLYTPEENGRMERFYPTSSRSPGCKTFRTIIDMEAHLKTFYHIYNHVRLHGSLDHLCPVAFWNLRQEGLIEKTTPSSGNERDFPVQPFYGEVG
jgi:transposase InsO family protein